MNHNAIRNTHPTVVTIIGDNSFDASGNPVVIDQSLVDTETARLQAESDSTQYQRDRAAAYAPLGDQFDMRYHDLQDSTTTWADHVAEIKARFPK
jgi:hypothetical protein